jgi:RNA polymerase sigma-70 factor (ECF subfamily)
LDDVEATYRRYFPLIREKCRRMLGDAAEADDVAQETFVRFWQSGLGASDARRTTAFIYKTCTRLAIDRMRERARRPGSDAELPLLPLPGAGTDEALAVRRQLLVLSRELPAGELEVALLSRLDRLTQQEIAAVLGVSDRTVRRSLTRFDERVAALRKEALP